MVEIKRLWWLAALNVYLLQWLGLRLFRQFDLETGKNLRWFMRMVRPRSGYNGKPYRSWNGKVLP